MPKTLQLTIPDEALVPEIIATFSPEENYLMLKIGSECLKEGRNAVVGLTQKEIYEKIKDETKEEVNNIKEAKIKHKIDKDLKKVGIDENNKVVEKRVRKSKVIFDI